MDGIENRYLNFPEWPFQIISQTILICVIAIVFCTPVIIQTAGVVSRGGAIASFGIVVPLGCVLLKIIFQDLATTTLMTLALAALLSNCLKGE